MYKHYLELSGISVSRTKLCLEFVCFVQISTEDGAKGWGQVAPYCADITAEVLHRQVAPHVLGRDCDDLDEMLDLVRDREHKFPGAYLRRAMGGQGFLRSAGIGDLTTGMGVLVRQYLRDGYVLDVPAPL